jgi:hypothetical protein
MNPRAEAGQTPALFTRKGKRMAQCEICGNDYDKTFEVRTGGRMHVFDCFECAIQALAPVCRHCGCKIIGHGVEAGGNIYCCANCANREGVHGIRDRVHTNMVSA